jgi:hypothetical protein
MNSMNKITLDDVLGLAAYEQVRGEFRDAIIDKKKKRRVSVGDKISFVFENRDTVIFQIQEMVRAERIADLDKIREEIAVYNQLIPNPGELSATLFLEIEVKRICVRISLSFWGLTKRSFSMSVVIPSAAVLKRGTVRRTKSAPCNT